jgi:hypothetical protein
MEMIQGRGQGPFANIHNYDDFKLQQADYVLLDNLRKERA